MTILNDYDPWSRQVLLALQSGGPDAARTAAYILANNVGIVIVDNDATNLWWKVKWSWKGPQIRQQLYVSRFIAGKPPSDAWVLMEFVHETRHLQQGFWTAFSVYGEFEAWQLGFRFYLARPDRAPVGQFIRDLLELPLTHEKAMVRQAQELINLYENGGTSFKEQVLSLLGKEKTFHGIYWIKALPLNPFFKKRGSW
jgi:hypothetical protein